MHSQRQKCAMVTAASFFSVLNYVRIIFLVGNSQEIILNDSNVCGTCERRSVQYITSLHATWERESKMINFSHGEKLILPKYGDRIEAQLQLSLASSKITRNAYRKPKKILIIDGYPHGVYPGDLTFRHEKCSVNQCILTDNSQLAQDADAVIFQGNIGSAEQSIRKSPKKVWIYYQLESPVHSDPFYKPHRSFINWTATYRRDSTIVTPYAKYVPYSVKSGALDAHAKPMKPIKDYAEGKTKAVAWFVSNCMTTNSRMEYVRELQRYITVDIYGDCGNLKCSKSAPEECFRMLKRQYKFYLAFENSSCKDYITEKLFVNSLMNDVVPVVLGAKKEDYIKIAPPGSFIHVDDFQSPKHLAEYLHVLQNNNTLYNEYFKWKNHGYFVHTKFWCRVCAMLHHMEGFPMWYSDIEAWWKAPNICH